MNSPVIRTDSAPLAGAMARLAGIVLVRLATGSASEAQLSRDLGFLTAAATATAGNEPACQIGRLVEALVATGHIARKDDRLSPTAAGLDVAADVLGSRKPLSESWAAVRDGALIAMAFDMSGAPARRLAALSRLDGLQSAIVILHWGLGIKGKPSLARIRHALALVALDRAFGNRITSEIGSKSGLSSKASRLLAGELSRTPKDYGTDGRLIAALAAEAVCARRSTLAELRSGVLRTYVGGSLRRQATPAKPGVAPEPGQAKAMPLPTHRGAASEEKRPPPIASLATTAPAVQGAPAAPAMQRPDPAAFARAVRSAVAARAEGWPGNRRAFVSDTLDLIRERHPEWAISDIEFKAMLVEAHRVGHLVLVNADLKDKRRLKEVQASAIPWKNTVWHYIRADE